MGDGERRGKGSPETVVAGPVAQRPEEHRPPPGATHRFLGERAGSRSWRLEAVTRCLAPRGSGMRCLAPRGGHLEAEATEITSEFGPTPSGAEGQRAAPTRCLTPREAPSVVRGELLRRPG